MAPPAAQQSPEEMKQRRLLTTLISLNAVSLVLLLASIGVGVALSMTKLNRPPPRAAEGGHGMPGPSLKIDDAAYNLGEMNRYMKAAMTIELDVIGMKEKESAEFFDEARQRLPWIKDLVISELSGKTYRDVATPAGKEQLKEELRVRINALLSRGEVKEVMFTSFAVQ